jgi:hypothetical protein
MKSKGCSISGSKAFEKSIPPTIRDEIGQVINLTKKTAKEQSLTFCKLKGKEKIFVSDYSVGNKNETQVMPCRAEHGHAEKVGDLHTHPTQDPTTVGITPSTSDIVSTLTDSVDEKIPQISCITGPDAKMIHCYQAKREVMKNPDKVKGYKQSMNFYETGVADIPPFIRENVADDFIHAWYNRHTWERVFPKAKDVVRDAFINSKNFLKFEDIPDLEKGSFCDVIGDLNNPDNEDRVSMECRKALKVREFLGFEF